jgi:hypothetical protein
MQISPCKLATPQPTSLIVVGFAEASGPANCVNPVTFGEKALRIAVDYGTDGEVGIIVF